MRFPIVLPGSSSPAIQVYDFITQELCVVDGSKMRNAIVEKIPLRNYLREK